MKKILYFAAAAALVVFSVTSCKGKNGSDEPEDGKYVIEVTDAQYNHAGIKVTVQDTTVSYFMTAIPAADFAEYASDAAAIDSLKAMVDFYINYYNEYYKSMYEMYGMEWTEEDAYSYSDFTINGNAEGTEIGLKESTQYYEVLFELDANGKTGDKLYKKAFETPAFKATSELKIEVEYANGSLSFTPSNNTEKYFCSLVTEDDLSYYGFSNVTEMAEDDITFYGDEELTEYCETGVQTFSLASLEQNGNIAAGDVCYGYAYGYANGMRTTEVFSQKFTYQSSAAAPAHKAGRALVRPFKKQDARNLLRK